MQNSPWRMGLFALASLVFVAGGLWITGAFGPDHPEGVEATIAGWVCIVLFGFMAIIFVRRAFDSGPVLRIDDRGIWWKQWSSATIPWSAVADLHNLEVQGQQMLGVELTDPTLYPCETWIGRLAGANRALTGVDAIWLNTTGTGRKFAELEAAVLSHVRTR